MDFNRPLADAKPHHNLPILVKTLTWRGAYEDGAGDEGNWTPRRTAGILGFVVILCGGVIVAGWVWRWPQRGWFTVWSGVDV